LANRCARVRAAGGHGTYTPQLSTGVTAMFPATERAAAEPEPEQIDAAVSRAIGSDADDLLFVLHNAPDEAAHRHGAASPEYFSAMMEADRMLAAIYAAVDLERDAVVAVADHGHTD